MQKNSKKITDPEAVIEFLTEKGVKINAMTERLGIDRSALSAWRRSVKEGRRAELARQLIEAYQVFFEEGEEQQENATNAILAGIPITEVMKFTGHRSVAAFMQYIRTTEIEAAIAYANHPFFQ